MRILSMNLIEIRGTSLLQQTMDVDQLKSRLLEVLTRLKQSVLPALMLAVLLAVCAAWAIFLGWLAYRLWLFL